jgi:ABC-2 type transport system permease protein
MNIRRILSVARRDLLSSLRDRLLGYLMLAPLLLGVGLRFFLPSIGAASLSFALGPGVGAEVVETIRTYGAVSLHDDLAALEERVAAGDDVAGIARDAEGGLYVILQGDESHDTVELSQAIVRAIEHGLAPSVVVTESDIGAVRSPVATYGFIMLAMTSLMMAGFVIGFNVIEEKESDTLRALTVTPLRRGEFIAGRSLVGVAMPLLHLVGLGWILGVANVDWGMLAATIAATSLSGILLGFLIGVLSNNQMSGIANGKVLFMLYSIAPVGAMVLPESRAFLLYWAPTYWGFRAMQGIVLGEATWGWLAGLLAALVGVTALYAVGISRRVRVGLTPS